MNGYLLAAEPARPSVTTISDVFVAVRPGASHFASPTLGESWSGTLGTGGSESWRLELHELKRAER